MNCVDRLTLGSILSPVLTRARTRVARVVRSERRGAAAIRCGGETLAGGSTTIPATARTRAEDMGESDRVS